MQFFSVLFIHINFNKHMELLSNLRTRRKCVFSLQQENLHSDTFNRIQPPDLAGYQHMGHSTIHIQSKI